MESGQVIAAGTLLIILGFIIMVAGILAGSKPSHINVRGAGVVFIGPIPLIF